MAQARERAKAEGLPFVEPAERNDGVVLWRRLDRDGEVAAVRMSGRIAAGCEPSGQFVYLQAVESVDEQGRGDSRELAHQATGSRRSAAEQFVRTRPASRAVADALADAVLFDGFDYAAALKLTHQWIGDSVGITSREPRLWRNSLRAEDNSTRAWVAWVLTIAAAEARAARSETWGDPERRYLRMLRDKAGYSPAKWECERLAGQDVTQGDSDGITPNEQERAS